MTSEYNFSDYREVARFHYDRTIAYQESGELDKALEECDEALNIDWESAYIYNLRGIILEGLGRLREAAKAYKKAIELDPEFEEAGENMQVLVSKLGESLDLVDIATFYHPGEAYLLQGKLESEGIRALVATSNWSGSNAVGEAKLQVEAKNVHRALEILNGEAGISFDAEVDTETDEFYCENCGKDVEEDWQICPYCGDSLEEIDTD